MRPLRQSPGQDALNKWSLKPPKSPSRRLVGKLAQWRSEALPSLLIVLACLVIGVLVISLYKPGVALTRATATIVCASPRSVPTTRSISITATVIAPGSPAVPTGTVTFWDGTDRLDSNGLDENGMSHYESGSLAIGDHTITAKYGGSSGFSAKRQRAVCASGFGRSSDAPCKLCPYSSSVEQIAVALVLARSVEVSVSDGVGLHRGLLPTGRVAIHGPAPRHRSGASSVACGSRRFREVVSPRRKADAFNPRSRSERHLEGAVEL